MQVAKQLCDARHYTILYNQANGLFCSLHLLDVKQTVTGRVHLILSQQHAVIIIS